jgi:hypothetical protein
MLREFLSQTAQETSQGLHMKLRNHICIAVLLGIASTVLFAGSNALGQGLQPPFMAPTPPSLMYGVFYFQAGAKYRNVDTFRFDVVGRPNTIVIAAGTVPFGPTTAGPFGVGTGKDGFRGTGFPPLSWTYDDGAIYRTPTPAGIAIGCAGPPAVASCEAAHAPDTNFAYSVVQPLLGREVVLIGSADCCNGLSIPQEFGSFSIVDPIHQTNTSGTIADTTTVTFTFTNPTSLSFLTDTTPDSNRIVDANAWGPTFEMGYQFSNYFDLFYGFSWFNISNSMTLSNTIQGQGARVTITDTFPFLSDDPSAWPVFNFNSSNTIIGATANHFYQIAPNGPGNGIQPSRQFSTNPDATIPNENIQETLSNRAEFTPFENRFGARSWAPLFGLGRIGATLGTAVIPTYYKITGSSSYIASGSSGTVPAGTVLAAQVSDNKDWRTLYGLFVGGDLSLGNTGYFLYASGDYMWATYLNYELNAVKTTFNPGGFTAAFNAGIQF